MTMRTYSTAWTATAVTVLAFGVFISLLALPATNVASIAVGVLTLSYLGERLTSSRPVQLRRLTLHLIVGIGGCFGLIGIVRLLGPGIVLPLLLLAAVSPQVISLAAHHGRLARLRGNASPAAAPPDRAPDHADLTTPDAVPAATPSWTDAELCQAWRTSFLALERSHDLDRRTELVRARQSYLDEIERRHPVGFARWLYAGARPASDPSRYLTQARADKGVPA